MNYIGRKDMTNVLNSKQASSDYQPFVSIIIPALNSGETLDSCLNAISLIDYPKEKLEVILVDNGSTDNTLEIAKKYNVRMFIKPKINISALRNFGVTMAKGEIFAFVDSDCIISKDWIKNAINIFLSNEKIAITGCSYGMPKKPSWIVKAWYLPNNSSLEEVNFIPAGNLLIRRGFFNKVGGFNEKLITGEDYDLCRRVREAGYLIMSSNLIKAVHLDDTDSLRKVLKKEIWYGKGMLPSMKNLFKKTVFLCHLFGVSIFGLVLAMIFNWTPMAMVSFSMLLGIPILSAWYRNFIKARSREAKYFFYLIPIYLTYYIGRSVSLIYIYKNMFLRNSRKKKS